MSRLFASLILMLCIFGSSLAHAGDRPLSVLLVNMTPDPVSEAGRACSARFRRLTRNPNRDIAAIENTTEFRAMGETALRTAVGRTDDFFLWDSSVFPHIRGDDGLDALIMFDCQPETQRIRAMVVTGSSSHRLTMNAELDRPHLDWFIEQVTRQSWTGFSP